MQERKLELQKELATVIKKYRKEQSISQLANEIDLSKSIWAGIEKGERDVQLSTFWRIAEALNIKPSQLLQSIESRLGDEFSFLENTPAKVSGNDSL